MITLNDCATVSAITFAARGAPEIDMCTMALGSREALVPVIALLRGRPLSQGLPAPGLPHLFGAVVSPPFVPAGGSAPTEAPTGAAATPLGVRLASLAAEPPAV